MNHVLLGNHPAIQKIRELIQVVSDTYFSVLITGETGTGKEVVARLLHQASPRKHARFIKVNCAALPLTLLESELFGYEKGAFTGADRQKEGKFEAASDGVIFLDEIGDMPLLLQAKLLEVLQSGRFTRLGGTKEVKVDSWVVSSTNHLLEEDIKQARFREDLYYRLNIIRIDIPALRERREDIPLLTSHFLERHGRDLEVKDFVLPKEMTRLFEEYPWPGNVRELSSVILRLMVGDDPDAVVAELRKNMDEGKPREPGEGACQAESREEVISLMKVKERASRHIEEKAILYALNRSGGNKRAAARMLKISFKTLYAKMRDIGMEKFKAES